MKVIRIMLEITDSETLDAYGDVDESFIEDDLRNGTLMNQCDVVKIKKDKDEMDDVLATEEYLDMEAE